MSQQAEVMANALAAGIVPGDNSPVPFRNGEGELDFDKALAVLKSGEVREYRRAFRTLDMFRAAAPICFACLRDEEACSEEPCATVACERGER